MLVAKHFGDGLCGAKDDAPPHFDNVTFLAPFVHLSIKQLRITHLPWCVSRSLSPALGGGGSGVL